jgi:hypothetical protein
VTKYELHDHRHRFSVWAAARATQRGLCDVDVLCDALEACGVVKFLESRDLGLFDASAFKSLHTAWCGAVLRHLREHRIARANFGHAAKLVGMYLKSMVILGPHPETPFARVAHPPIDSILLRTLRKRCGCGRSHDWANVNWTQLDEAAYYGLVDRLRGCIATDEPFWKLEQYWAPKATVGPNHALQRTHSRVTSRAEGAHGPRHAARR